MLADPGGFLDSLMKYDKESITEDMIKKLTRYVNNPDYQPAKIQKVKNKKYKLHFNVPFK